MLRVRTATRGHETTLVVEGRLAGPWVEELAVCWQSARAEREATSIHVDLDGVTFIGASGTALLAEIHRQGATLVGHGCMTRAVVDEIIRQSSR